MTGRAARSSVACNRAGIGPAVVTLKNDGTLVDVTAQFPTVSQLFNESDPLAALKQAATAGESLGLLSAFLCNKTTQTSHLLAPIDLQAIKAAGVTFAVSMVERLVEERCRGNPDQVTAIRAKISAALGGQELAQSALVPHRLSD